MTSSTMQRPGVVLAVVCALAGGAVLGRFASRAKAPRALPPPAARAAAAETKSAEATPKRFLIPVTSSQPSKGPAEALVTVIEWSDIRCSRCAPGEDALEAVRKEYGDALRVVWRSRFQEDVPDSLAALDFAMEAHTQAGKFWQAMSLLRGHSGPLAEDILVGFGKTLGLDATGVKQAIGQQSHRAHIVNDAVFAERFGVTELPAFFIDGVPFAGPKTPAGFKAAIEPEMTRARGLVSGGVAPDKVYAELTKDGLWNVPEWKAPQPAQ